MMYVVGVSSFVGCALSMFSAMIAWLCFARINMPRLEKSLKEQGIERVDWDGPGFRVLSYTIIILFKTKRLNDDNYPFVPVTASRQLATQTDWWLSLWLWGSFGIAMVCMIILSVFFPELLQK
ncbi:hypothetical protein [Agarivorans sp. QJM3NY_25]|uniref:hypothetical protein n=1 Tax=Agarivorans sp. QJM3NY_25 TaxID=3421430 RepID=UPI003D7E5C18